MTLAELRDAAIDRALVGDDPRAALALAGAADIAIDDAAPDTAGALAAATLAVTVTFVDRDPPLDGRAWRPGTDADPLALAGAAAAVRVRNVSLDRAARLVGCAPETVEKASQKRNRN